MKTHLNEFSIKALSRAMGIQGSGFYAHQKVSAQGYQRAKLLEDIRRVYGQHQGRYGSPRGTLQLQKEGVACSENRVARLMKTEGLAGICPGRKTPRTTDSAHGGPIAQNLTKGLQIKGLNQVWAMDITYIRTQTGWVYLGAVLDMYSRKIVGWQMAQTMEAALVVEALNRALARSKCSEGLIVHSDRGSQYASEMFRRLLHERQIEQSMSAKGNCYDNATMESFFGTLKREDLDRVEFSDLAQARSRVFSYIETYYNQHRIHTSLEGLSPLEFEEHCTPEKGMAPTSQRFFKASDAPIGRQEKAGDEPPRPRPMLTSSSDPLESCSSAELSSVLDDPAKNNDSHRLSKKEKVITKINSSLGVY